MVDTFERRPSGKSLYMDPINICWLDTPAILLGACLYT